MDIKKRSYGNGLQRKRLWQQIQKHWFLYCMLILPLVWLVIFKYIPMYGVSIAFKDFSFGKGYAGSPWVGLKHFVRFFKSANFQRLVTNTIILSSYSLVAGFFCNIIFALMVNELRTPKYKKTIQMVSYLPHFISTVVVVSILNQMFSLNGLINAFLGVFGIDKVSFFNSADTFRHMYVWSGIWTGVGYNSVIYIAALAKVDVQLYEAAELDGANRLQKIWHINIPCIVPTMTILLILSLSNIMSVGYEKVLLMQTNVNLSKSQILSTYVYEIGMIKRQYSFSTAVEFVNSIVNIVFLLIANFAANRLTGTSLF